MSSARDLALGLIMKHERCVLHPYQDPVPKWTIGWGNRFFQDGTPVAADTYPITQVQADALLDFWVDKTMTGVERLVTYGHSTDNQIAALTSFAYNEGLGDPVNHNHGLAGSTLLRLYNQGFVKLAADQFNAWIYAGGRPLDELRRRRVEEKALFLKDADNVNA